MGDFVLESKRLALDTWHITKFLSFLSHASHLHLSFSTSLKGKSYNLFRIPKAINRRHQIIYTHIKFWDLMAEYNSQVVLIWSYNIPSNIRMEHYYLLNSILFQKGQFYRLCLPKSSEKLQLDLEITYSMGEFQRSLWASPSQSTAKPCIPELCVAKM